MNNRKLKKGDILLFKGEGNWKNFWKSKTNFFQFMIKIGTMSPYCHAGIVLDVKDDYITIGEALDNGFVIWDSYGHIQDKIMSSNIVVYRDTSLSVKERNLIVKEAYKLEGKPYAWWDIFAIIIYIITGKVIKTTNTKKLICSEAVARAYFNAGFILVPDKDLDLVTPQDLAMSDVKRILLKELSD